MGLVGSNGAGKTTTLQLILNMLVRDGGTISVFGLDNMENETAIKQEIGVVFDSSFFVDTWTVNDTQKAISIFYDNWDSAVFDSMIVRFGLPKNKKIRDFSRGMQMKLMLACAMSHDAKLLILDEPTSGLDPAARNEFLEMLQDYIKDGERSVLFSTHITTDLERVADYITLLHQGQLIFTGSKDGLLESYKMMKGCPADLTPEIEKSLIGLRKTNVGFEGLMPAKEAQKYKNYMIEAVSIDDIIICMNRGGRQE